jgi:hypothetical protein
MWQEKEAAPEAPHNPPLLMKMTTSVRRLKCA